MANQAVSLLSRLFYTAAKSGEAPGRGQSLPFHPEVSDARARALPVGAGVRPAGPRARGARIRGHGLDERGRGAAPADADRPAGRNEIVTLRWEHVDLEHDELRLRDAENWRAGGAALARGETSPDRACRAGPTTLGVFPGRVRGTRLRTLNASWLVVRKEAGLEDVRLHDLRHSFASRALALGESLPMIGKLLGHTQVQTTARYAHLGRNSGQGRCREDRGQPRSRHGHAAGRFRRPVIYATRFASYTLALREKPADVRKLLGHSEVQTTA